MKEKLKPQHIFNSYSFYDQQFGAILGNEDKQKLSTKILDLVEYDTITEVNTFEKHLPLDSLCIIYFICEYKKAYELSKHEYKKNRKQTLESLGKGFPKKKEIANRERMKALDSTLSDKDRIVAELKRYGLFSIKNARYSKVGFVLLSLQYITYPLVYRILEPLFSKSRIHRLVLEAVDETRQYFEYTYLSNDKIINSLVILLYERLTIVMNIDKKIALKWVKSIVESLIDDNPLPTDKYRLDCFDTQEKYFAGIYKGLPIFQLYTGSKEHYYSDQDIRKLQDTVKTMPTEGFMFTYLVTSLSKYYKLSMSPKQIIEKIQSSDVQLFRKAIDDISKLYVIAPPKLNMSLQKRKNNFILIFFSYGLAIFMLFRLLYTKFAKLKTIFTKK